MRWRCCARYKRFKFKAERENVLPIKNTKPIFKKLRFQVKRGRFEVSNLPLFITVPRIRGRAGISKNENDERDKYQNDGNPFSDIRFLFIKQP